jgi:fatty acid desaturase
MHHIENNVFDEDLSSTEPYQRDNFGHFLIYFYRYWTHLYFLPMYAIRKERYELAFGAFLGSSIWFSSIFFGMKTHFIFTLYTLVIPAVVVGFALMFGNFSQHIFVHPSVATMAQDLKSTRFNCALTYQSINHEDNQFTFNDGYHITHHINSRCHWTEMPYEFINNIDRYAECNAIVFDGLSIFEVGVNVMLGNWDTLF